MPRAMEKRMARPPALVMGDEDEYSHHDDEYRIISEHRPVKSGYPSL